MTCTQTLSEGTNIFDHFNLFIILLEFHHVRLGNIFFGGVVPSLKIRGIIILIVVIFIIVMMTILIFI